VLEGVPEDLQHVIQKLTAKNQKDRYKSADEALSDLNIDANLTSVRPALGDSDNLDQEEGEEGERSPAEKKRLMMLAGAFAFSMILSLSMVFMGGKDSGSNGGTSEAARLVGYVRDIDLENQVIIYNNVDFTQAAEIKVGESPLIYFRNNDENILLREIEKSDRIIVEKREVSEGKFQLSITVDRPDVTYGRLVTRDMQRKRITIEIEEGPERGSLSLKVPERPRIKINNQQKQLVELKDGDMVRVRHLPDVTGSSGRIMSELVALRPEEMTGYISQIKMSNPPELTVRFGRSVSSGTGTILPLAEDVIIQQNGSGGEKINLDLAELEEGDRVRIVYDVEIREVLVTREERQSSGVVQSIENGEFMITQDDRQKVTFSLDNSTEVTVNGGQATPDDLRKFDRLMISWDDSSSPPKPVAVDAKRPILNDRWAILIANESYTDQTLPPASNAVRDVELLKSALVSRYAFATDRVIVLMDETKAEITKVIRQIVSLSRRDSQVVVFVKGHVYQAQDENMYLAVKDTNRDNLTGTGLSLLTLLEPLENSSTTNKFLLLEVCSAELEQDLRNQPSSGDALKYLVPGAKSTTLIAACQPDQKSLEDEEAGYGLFAQCLAEAFRGSADLDRNLRVTPQELSDFLTSCLPTKTPTGKKQTPEIHLPSP